MRFREASTGSGKSNLGLDRRKQGSIYDMGNNTLPVISTSTECLYHHLHKQCYPQNE